MGLDGSMGLWVYESMDQNTCKDLKVDFPKKKFACGALLIIRISFTSVTVTLLKENLKL